MTNVYKNIILRELENVPDKYLAEVLNYIHFLKHEASAFDDENPIHIIKAYITSHPSLPDYIVVNNHLN